MITVVGMGPGNPDFIFEAGKQAIREADFVIGSKRQLEMVQLEQDKACLLPPNFQELRCLLLTCIDDQLVILASGDPLTYGIGNWLLKTFEAKKVRIIPGISAIHYLFSQVQLSMEDCFITSSHGRTPDFDRIATMPKVGMVTDKKIGPYQIAQEVLKRGGKKKMLIGESLSYPNQRLRWYLLKEVPDEDYEMNVVVIVDEG